jgi:4-hydroxy-L-threonine phosphate dehydrogenase PdxA
MDKLAKIRLGITVGDLNGIGMEVIIKTFMEAKMTSFCTPIVYGSSRTAGYHRKALGSQSGVELVGYGQRWLQRLLGHENVQEIGQRTQA